MKGSAVPVLAFPDFKLPFILTTDASKVAIRAILSQVQNGIECPIAYASRQLNNAERAYTVSEQEMWFRLANKHFQYYLFGKQFLVRTDHSALKYLQNFPDQNSRLMRWSLKLSELDFVVEHRTGSKIGHVDAPSRHVGAILQEEILDRKNIFQEQAKDAFCTKQNPRTYKSKKVFFFWIMMEFYTSTALTLTTS